MTQSKHKAALLFGMVVAGGGCIAEPQGQPDASPTHLVAQPAGHPAEQASRLSTEPQPSEASWEEASDDGHGVVSRSALPFVKRPMTDDEWAMLRAEKAKYKGVPSPPMPDPVRTATDETLAHASSLSPDEDVRLLVKLGDLPFDFRALSAWSVDEGQRAAVREAAIEARKAQLKPSQDAAEEALTRLGARDMVRYWLGGNDVLVTLAAKHVRAVANLPGVRGIERDEVGGMEADAYSPYDARYTDASMGQRFIDAGYDASHYGSSYAAPIKLAIFEIADWLDPNHYAYDYPGQHGTPNRIKAIKDCSTGVCVDNTNILYGNGHGQKVTGVAAASILDGQDPAYPGTNTVAQRHRSGHAPRSEILYYAFGGSYGGLRSAIQNAVSLGAHVGNMSFTYEQCNNTTDHENVNAALRDATNAGMIIFASTGNTASSVDDMCEFAWPGTRPDVISVGGLDSWDDGLSYRDLNMRTGTWPLYPPACAMGGFSVGVNGVIFPEGSAGVGLTAPGVVTNTLGASPGNYNSPVKGSSYATPMVAGSAAQLRHAFGALGWASTYSNARLMEANMLLMGDGWDGNNVTAPGGSVFPRVGPNRRSGMGRLRMRYPSGANLTNPWHWGTGAETISQGQTIQIDLNGPGAESSSITEWKWVAHWTETDLTNIADIDISVWNTCPSGGGSPVKLYWQEDYDFRNRIHLLQGDIGGRCLQMRVYGYYVPSPRTIYMAQMYHGGTVNP